MLFFLNTEKIQQTGHNLALIWKASSAKFEYGVESSLDNRALAPLFLLFHLLTCLSHPKFGQGPLSFVISISKLSLYCLQNERNCILIFKMSASVIVYLILSWKTYLLLYFNYWSKCWARTYLPIWYEVICMYHIYLYCMVVSMGKINRQLCKVSSVICNATKSVTILVVSTTLRDSLTVSYLPNILNYLLVMILVIISIKLPLVATYSSIAIYSFLPNEIWVEPGHPKFHAHRNKKKIPTHRDSNTGHQVQKWVYWVPMLTYSTTVILQ